MMARSPKIDVPPAAELERARRQILEKLASFNARRDKLPILSSSEAEQRRQEEIADQITKLLRNQKRPKQSEVAVYNQVVVACLSVEPPTRSTKPADVEAITNELVNASRKLLRILGRSDFPPNYVFRVFGYVDKWNQFIDHLERLAGIEYRKPARNIDRVKRDCAKVAYLLIIECANKKPTSTRGGLFHTVAGLLHQFARPTADGDIVDFKTACDAVCNRAKAGIKIETDRW